MTSSENTSEKNLKNPINYKIIALIVVIGTIHYYAMLEEDGSQIYPTDIFYVITILLCGVMSIVVAIHYKGSEIFTKAYFFLGIGFFSWFVAEILWLYNIFVLNIDPYPSWADPFYFAYYVLGGIHLYLNTKFFKKSWNSKIKAWLIGFPIIVTVAYIGFAYSVWGENDELTFDLFYGATNVLGITVVFTFAIFGAVIFRQSVLGSTWLLLAIGLMILGIADFWYYLLEVPEEYTLMHPVNAIWPFGFMTVIYALYLHRKAI